MKNGFYATYRSKNKGKDKRSINLSVFLNSLLADNHHLQVGSNYLYIHKIDHNDCYDHLMIWAQIAHADVTNIRIEELKEHQAA